jgi:hypothetical protein
MLADERTDLGQAQTKIQRVADARVMWLLWWLEQLGDAPHRGLPIRVITDVTCCLQSPGG